MPHHDHGDRQHDDGRDHDGGQPQAPQPAAAVDGAEAPEEGGIVLVDASNVAHSSEGDRARFRNIELICNKLLEEGLEPIVVADAALRHQIDDADEYERRVEEGKIKQAPAGTDADYFILAFARELDAGIVSNDRFRDRADAFPEARERVIRYMILNDEVVLERRTRRR
jgi:hypothetical protein